MKTKVNLYASEFHPKLRLLTLRLIVMVCSLVLVLCSGCWLYAVIQQQRLTADFKVVEQQKSQHLSTVKALQVELANAKKDPQLLIDLEHNMQKLALKQRVLQKLQGQEELKNSGFAKLMLELADNHQNGLWLNHINLDGGNVQLEGVAIESFLIPKWLNSLGATAYFKGQEFSETRLFRNEEQQINFVIGSSVTGEQDNTATGASRP